MNNESNYKNREFRMKGKHLQVPLSHDGKNRATNIAGNKKHTIPHSNESLYVLKRPHSW